MMVQFGWLKNTDIRGCAFFT
uniref:Uncharacterized protein n=1 Tax=Arundo donax TaxID=35708 RepID=A0A0A9CB27_ARUDO